MKFLFNYYTILSVVVVLFCSFLSFYLFTVKNKEKSTKYLGIFFLGAVFFYASYLFSYLTISPLGAYHRIGTVSTILTLFMVLGFFLHNYKGLLFPREYQIIKYIQPPIILLNLIIFIIGISGLEAYFEFTGKTYNIIAGKLTSILLLLFLLYSLLTAIRKTIKLQGKDRKSLLYLSIVIFTVFLLPVVTNILSLNNIIKRNIHMNIFYVTPIIGYFIFMMVYINYTKEKSTFMVKIVSITVVVVLLLIQSIAMIVMPNRDRLFNEVSRSLVSEAVEMKVYSKEIAYVAINRNENFKFVYKKERVRLKAESLNENQISCKAKNKKAGNFSRKGYIEFNRKKTGADTLLESGRIFRCNPDKKRLFISYQVKSRKGERYEVGLDFEYYRSFLHQMARYLVYITIFLFFFVLIIFPLFFRSSLVNPLYGLLSGVESVEKGDLNTTISVQVNDEIGSLTGSFNGMVDSIREAHNKLQDYADNLEDKVKVRTRELKQTLDEVQALKQKQDGDYFLTSLLIKPLGLNKIESETIKVDFFVEQKKKFKFRKWAEQIGGDICIAHSIKLKNRCYTVFINADAMGKSMQGAGGTLVLGAVFQSIIDRTKLVPEAQNVFPEQWLKYTFEELHKVFESFNGSMLMSIAMGLIDDVTGLLYYMNAEHPWSVLYRDGRAEFIEEELTFHKLGSSIIHGKLSVTIFQLQPGDVLIAGSDGRDDILIGSPEGKMNENEFLFLEEVEKNDANLEKIFESSKAAGEITDDFSLLRVSFKENQLEQNNFQMKLTLSQIETLAEAKMLQSRGDKEAAKNKLLRKQHEKSIIQYLRLLSKISFSEKKYAEALDFANKLIEVDPSDSEVIFLISVCLRKLKKYVDSIDYGERLRLRTPDKLKNLQNLAEVYALTQNYSQSKVMLEKILILQPGYKRAERLKEKIKQANI